MHIHAYTHTYICDGHVYGTWTVVDDWATVYCIVIGDVGTRPIHRSCLRHRSIYSTFGGKDIWNSLDNQLYINKNTQNLNSISCFTLKYKKCLLGGYNS